MHQQDLIHPFNEKTNSQLQANLQKQNKQSVGTELNASTENENKS